MIRIAAVVSLLLLPFFPFAGGWEDNYLFLSGSGKSEWWQFFLIAFKDPHFLNMEHHPLYPTGLWMFASQHTTLYLNILTILVLLLLREQFAWFLIVFLSPFTVFGGGEFSFLLLLFTTNLLTLKYIKKPLLPLIPAIALSAFSLWNLPLALSAAIIRKPAKLKLYLLLLIAGTLLPALFIFPQIYEVLRAPLWKMQALGESFFQLPQGRNLFYLSSAVFILVSSSVLFFFLREKRTLLIISLTAAILSLCIPCSSPQIFLFFSTAFFLAAIHEIKLWKSASMGAAAMLPILIYLISAAEIREELAEGNYILPIETKSGRDALSIFDFREAQTVVPFELTLIPLHRDRFVADSLHKEKVPFSQQAILYFQAEKKFSDDFFSRPGKDFTILLPYSEDYHPDKEEPPFSHARSLHDYFPDSKYIFY